MKAGDLSRLITIQSRDTGTDAAGQPVQTWATVASVWADVRGATGMAAIRQSSPVEGVALEANSYSFRIRYRTGLDAGMRVTLGSDVYDIKQVRMDHAGKVWTDLVCETGGNDG